MFIFVSINQSINQSSNQSINQSINQSMTQPINQNQKVGYKFKLLQLCFSLYILGLPVMDPVL